MASDIIIRYDDTRHGQMTFVPDTCLTRDADEVTLDRGQRTIEFNLDDKEPPIQIDVPGAKITVLIAAREVRIMPLLENKSKEFNKRHSILNA